MSRFIVGIDLGTTHSALAYAESDGGGAAAVFAVPQLVARSAIDARPLLPSFLYIGHESDGPLALPWDNSRPFAVGEYARSRGADAPGRLISSAKSWLSHGGIDRRAGILPLVAPPDVEKISPVEASFRYLEHLAEAWDHAFAAGDPQLKLAAQEVVITVPASFDASARELTVEAALAAGIDNLTLLEEPQAALYAWIEAKGDAWRRELRVGDVILVVDVGGGTTDFSAIAVLEKEGALELVRVAVGDHILLGGDNMDLALAHVVTQKLIAAGKELDKSQQASLVHACRHAKEMLLANDSLESVPIVLAGRGSQLLGSSIRTELVRGEVVTYLQDGFFPIVPKTARPASRTRAALTQLGLPYASDPAVTKHLASFLGRQVEALSRLPGHTLGGGAPGGRSLLHPTAVLFNGGVMKGEPLRKRIIDSLNGWLVADGGKEVRVLDGADLDLAVARGAAAYARAKKGKGLRIRGGTARAYYIGVESSQPAIPGMEPPIVPTCIAPFGVEEGAHAAPLLQELGVVVGEPVRFRFFGSSVRRSDEVGVELERFTSDELEELSPIEVTLPSAGRRAGDVVPVRINASVTEVGTLLVEAVPLSPKTEGERWRVELSVRQGT